jgi:hypothetical protein
MKETKQIELTYLQAKELRRALGQAIRDIDCIEEEKRYEIIGELYDLILDIEDALEPKEEE